MQFTLDKGHFITEVMIKYANEELKDELRNIPIEEVARYMGFKVLRAGNFYTLKEHDSVRIDPRKNTYVRYSKGQTAGSVFDFVMEFNNMTFLEAINYLNDRYGTYSKEISNSFNKK